MISAAQAGDDLEVRVRDGGAGVPDELHGPPVHDLRQGRRERSARHRPGAVDRAGPRDRERRAGLLRRPRRIVLRRRLRRRPHSAIALGSPAERLLLCVASLRGSLGSPSSLLFRRVEVAGLERCPRDRPVLLVANHFNGFVDPVLIATALGRLPRFIAKAGLRKIPIAGLVLRARRRGVRAPAGRHRTARTATRTRSSSATAHSPSATSSRSSPRAPPTTGRRSTRSRPAPRASRSARGPRARTEVAIVPVGLTFPDKVALRSSALVQFGLPIELDVVAPGARRRRGRRRRPPAHRGHRPRHPGGQPRLPRRRDRARPRPGRAGRPQQPGRSRPVARGAGRPRPPARARHAGGAGGRAARRRPLPHHPRPGCSLTDADVIRPTNPARLLRSAFWIAVLVVLLGGLVAATVLINVWPAALVIAREPAREDAGVEGHRPRPRRSRRVPDRVDHRWGAGRRRRARRQRWSW